MPASHNSAGLSEPAAGNQMCRLEFLVEPFSEGNPGPHVLGPLTSLRRHGIEVNQGPFGNTVEGDRPTVINALLTVLADAFDNGASRILINLSQGNLGLDDSGFKRPSTVPYGEAAGGHAVADDPLAPGKSVLGSGRPEDIHSALDRIVGAVEDQMGGPLGDLSREKKQAAVRILDEQGVFLIRKSVETIAESMGVSRITIYNYLNAIRGD